MSRQLWIDASMGASGDMLLGALAGLGAGPVIERAVASTGVAEVRFEPGTSGPLAGTRAIVTATEAAPVHRHLAEVLAILDAAGLDLRVRSRARRVFARLAKAEGRVHGIAPTEVHFHEVGAADAIADVVGVCAGLVRLDASVAVSPVAFGGGTATSEHGRIPVPVPAVVELFADSELTGFGGPVDSELCTPTGAALLTEWATSCGPMPPLQIRGVGVGLGSKVFAERPNALRIVHGELMERADPAESADPVPQQQIVIETNIDDLDGRLWPGVLARLLEAGARDAWITPIVMKKGRPAHTLSVLTELGLLEAVATIITDQTTAIGLRWYPVSKLALGRDEVTVEVAGQQIRVKRALRDGRVVNAQPEFVDVAAAAKALGLPEKAVLQMAIGRLGEPL